ncbi:MAG: FxLYD domain-containing protein [Chloroflexota bacterium]|nr:FxLYD domain-containing protein [Chloroflexota bacterium]MDE2840907.1 FxLYD domain-containing protein [Chloroflexota bacterium]MDE2930409.1 FxLYD domain-containing protein [Chloroflexota bacterium]
MISKKLTKRTLLTGPLLAALLGAGILAGCAGYAGTGEGRHSDGVAVRQGVTEREGDESGGEHSDRGERREGGGESGEAAMSSPITPLDQTWNGDLGGLAISARYDAAPRTIYYTVQNTTQQVLCYVQSEPHLKSGTQTVGELGPDVLGHLSPGQQVTSSIAVASEPKLAGVAFDGYVIHMEVFDCGGTGPAPHTGAEGGEGSGEGHGSGGEGSGSEGGGGEEATANQLAPDETFNTVRNGARLILSYDAGSNAFKGTVENTTNNVLRQVRVEVHLSNGAELGPTPRVDLAPGEKVAVNLPATTAAFTSWVAHAEVGSGGEGGGEHGGSGGEHGSGSEGSGGG